MSQNPEAISDCKWCHGTGRVNYGNVCSGFGGRVETTTCMCLVYKKIKMDPETGEKTK